MEVLLGHGERGEAAVWSQPWKEIPEEHFTSKIKKHAKESSWRMVSQAKQSIKYHIELVVKI